MTITEATIRSLATAQSFERGQDYFYSGAVYDLQKRGETLMAEVTGSSYEPYQVTVELSEDEILSTTCTCPYDWGGDCKHVVAVLLAYLNQPDRITERPPVDELLAGLGETELRTLLIDLLADRPHLADWIETRLPAQEASSSQPAASPDEALRPHPTPIDPAPFQRQVRQVLYGPDRWDYYATAGVANQVSELANQALSFIEAGDGRNALAVLEAVTEPFVDVWYEYDDSDGELSMVFEEIGSLFTEAILTADLSGAERQAWAEKLTTWQGELADYGVDSAFDAAIAAAEQGWDYPPLQKVLQEGQVTEKGVWEDEAPWFADELAVARLNVLERQGRTTEYLYLAEAEGQTALYLTMLVKLNRTQEAIDYGLKYAATTDDALALATALRQRELLQEAIKIAEHGLDLFGDTYSLAKWLRDVAAGSRPEVALKAAKIAFTRFFALEDYQAVKDVAGPEWPTVQEDLLAEVANSNSAYAKINIYLYEDMVDEAVQAVNDSGYIGYETLERVVDLAWPSHPDWAIRQCRQQAERIMDAGKSKYYRHALRWLEKARQAYFEANRVEDWHAYLEELISKHARKYSLRPGLEALRK